MSLFVYLFSELINKAGPFFVAFYIASAVNAEVFGFFALVFMVYEFVYIFVSANVQICVRVKFFKLPVDDFVFWASDHFRVVLVLSLFSFFVGFLDFLTFKSEFYIYVWLFSLLSILKSYSFFSLAYFQCANKPRHYFLVGVCYMLPYVAVVFSFFDASYPIFSWLKALALGVLVQFCVSLYLTKTIVLGLFSFRNFLDLKSSFLYAISFYPLAFAWLLKPAFERVFLADRLGMEALGVYSLIMQFVMVLIVVGTAFNLVLVPKLNRHLNVMSSRKVIFSLIGLCVIFAAFAAVMIVVSEFAIFRFYGVKYQVASPYLFQAFCASLPHVFVLFFANVLYYFDLQWFFAKVLLATYIFYSGILYVMGLSGNGFFDLSSLFLVSGILNLCLFIIVFCKAFFCLKLERGFFHGV